MDATAMLAVWDSPHAPRHLLAWIWGKALLVQAGRAFALAGGSRQKQASSVLAKL